MRFMVMVRMTAEMEAGPTPRKEDLEEMGAFNDSLKRYGITILEAEGLQPTSKAVRIKFGGGKPTVRDGPFAETKELIAGFWLLEAESKNLVVERFRHVPFERGEEIEIRQIFGDDDFAA